MELTIRVHQGQILVGSVRGGDVERFDCERQAAAYVAYKSVQKCRRHAFDGSCDFPSLHGRPQFSKAAFSAILDGEISRLRGSVRSLAA